MDVIFTVLFALFLVKFMVPFFDNLTKVVKDESERIHREGLMKTDGAFWSPNQDPTKTAKKH